MSCLEMVVKETCLLRLKPLDVTRRSFQGIKKKILDVQEVSLIKWEILTTYQRSGKRVDRCSHHGRPLPDQFDRVASVGDRHPRHIQDVNAGVQDAALKLQ